MKLIQPLRENTVAIITSEVSNSARFPLGICRGTEGKRRELASQYTKKFMKEIDKVSEKRTCSVDSFSKALNNTLGQNSVGYDVLPLESSLYNGSLERLCDIDTRVNKCGDITIEDTSSVIAGYNFHFPLTDKGELKINKSTAVHEVRHFFDHLCHPKTINFPSFHLMYQDERLNKYYEVYNDLVNNFYPFTTLKQHKKILTKKLNKMPTEDAIAALQCSRRSMKTELNAYTDEIEYLKQQPLRNMFSIYEIYKFLYLMRYKDKIKFTNEMLKIKLKEGREALKQNKINQTV